jgi:isopentenyldiphosphate isomerase
MKKNEEYFDIVDDSGKIIGKASRSECHGNPALIHRTVHAVVYHPDGRILLQKRSKNKDIQPEKWDTAVGGHLDCGEDFQTAAVREIKEELGISVNFSELEYLADAEIRNDIESENIKIYKLISSGPFKFQKEEISEIRFWKIDELRTAVSETPELFTPNLLTELELLEIIK